MSRITKVRRSCPGRRRRRAARTAIIRSLRAPDIISRRSLCHPGRNVFEELGPAFTLLAFDAGGEDVARIEDAARARKVPLKVVRDSQTGGREAYGCKLILVRPDQFIAWCGDEMPAAPEQLMAKAAGQ